MPCSAVAPLLPAAAGPRVQLFPDGPGGRGHTVPHPHAPHLKVLLVPAAARLSRFASEAALLASATAGFAFALFSFAFSFFAAAFSPEDLATSFLGGMVETARPGVVSVDINYVVCWTVRPSAPVRGTLQCGVESKRVVRTLAQHHLNVRQA